MDIAVIIPVLDAAKVIGPQLAALSRQDFAGSWEVVICDNGSSDDLLGAVEPWRPHLPSVRIVDASDLPGAGFARHVGLLATEATRIAFCDADDIVSPAWLRAIYEALDKYPVVSGSSASVAFETSEDLSPAQVLDTAEFPDGPPTRKGVTFAGGGNSGYRREALSQGIAFDYMVGQDGATSWRARAKGHQIGWAPEARILFRRRPGGRKTFRRAAFTGVAGVKHDREFPTLFPDGPEFPWRTILWLITRVPTLRQQLGRDRWRYRMAAGLGSAIEVLLPGLLEGIHRRRFHRGLRGGMAAEVTQPSTSPTHQPPWRKD